LENSLHDLWLENYLFCVCKVIYIFSFSQTFIELFLGPHYHKYASKLYNFIIYNSLPKDSDFNNFFPPFKWAFFYALILTATPHPPPHHIYTRAYLYYIIVHGDVGGHSGQDVHFRPDARRLLVKQQKNELAS